VIPTRQQWQEKRVINRKRPPLQPGGRRLLA